MEVIGYIATWVSGIALIVFGAMSALDTLWYDASPRNWHVRRGGWVAGAMLIAGALIVGGLLLDWWRFTIWTVFVVTALYLSASMHNDHVNVMNYQNPKTARHISPRYDGEPVSEYMARKASDWRYGRSIHIAMMAVAVIAFATALHLI